jgi:hypothetical protein
VPAYGVLGFDRVLDGDEVLRGLVLARIIEPTSKIDAERVETATMLPVINAFKTAHQLSDVTVVADAGMISEANQVALQAAGLSYILGARIPYLRTWSGSGATNILMRRFLTVWC